MTKSVFRPLVAVLLIGALAMIPLIAGAGSGTPSSGSASSMSSMESEIELLRSDLRSDRVKIVTEALKLEGPKADAFWPVYRKYQLELDKIGDQRLALFRDYAAHYSSMTDDKASALVKGSLDLQSKRTDLLKKYHKDFQKVLGGTDAAKLIQLESLVNALVDVQVGAELPLIQKPATAKH